MGGGPRCSVRGGTGRRWPLFWRLLVSGLRVPLRPWTQVGGVVPRLRPHVL